MNKINISIIGLYNYKPEIFEGLTLPEGIDKDVLINEILIKCGNLSLVYPDADFMQLAITNWATSEQDVWTRLYRAFTEDYNPIWNVDGITRENRTIDNTSNGTGVDSVKGFNSDTWAEHDKSDTDSTSNTEETYEQVKQGNIGVTKSQELLEAELEVRPKLNIYEYIANSFKKKFTIMIY